MKRTVSARSVRMVQQHAGKGNQSAGPSRKVASKTTLPRTQEADPGSISPAAAVHTDGVSQQVDALLKSLFLGSSAGSNPGAKPLARQTDSSGVGGDGGSRSGAAAAAPAAAAAADAQAMAAAAAAAIAQHPAVPHQSAAASTATTEALAGAAADGPAADLQPQGKAQSEKRVSKSSRAKRGRRRGGGNGSESSDSEDEGSSGGVAAEAERMCREALQRLHREARWSPQGLAALDRAIANLVQVQNCCRVVKFGMCCIMNCQGAAAREARWMLLGLVPLDTGVCHLASGEMSLHSRWLICSRSP